MSVRPITRILQFQRGDGIRELDYSPVRWAVLRKSIQDGGPCLIVRDPIMRDPTASPLSTVSSFLSVAAIAMHPEEASQIMKHHKNYSRSCVESDLPYPELTRRTGVISGLTTREFADVVHLRRTQQGDVHVSLVAPELVEDFYPGVSKARDMLGPVFHGEACIWMPPVECSGIAGDVMHFIEDDEKVRGIMERVGPQVAQDALSRTQPPVRGMYVTH